MIVLIHYLLEFSCCIWKRIIYFNSQCVNEKGCKKYQDFFFTKECGVTKFMQFLSSLKVHCTGIAVFLIMLINSVKIVKVQCV